MDVLHPVILYVAVALGAVGVGLALPRRGVNPQLIGAVIAASAAGLVILLLSLKAVNRGEGLPNPFFYIFSIIALGASLRVITHPRPVYAALFFILTILCHLEGRHFCCPCWMILAQCMAFPGRWQQNA